MRVTLSIITAIGELATACDLRWIDRVFS